MAKVSSNKTKILVIMPSMNKAGGIERFYMNYYKRMSSNFSFDFITHENDSIEYKKLIKSKGDNLYIFPKLGLKNIFNFNRNVKAFFNNHNDYDIVHCHMANAAWFYFKEAKKNGIKNLILHSHLTKYADVLSHSFRNFFLVKLGKFYCTHSMACGIESGKFLFGNKEFVVVNNAIDLKQFDYNKDYRNEIRTKYNLNSNNIVIGHVGRMAPVKNQKFLIKLLADLIEINKNYRLMIIGNGALKKDLLNYAKELKVDKYLILVDATDKVYKYYQAFDLFALPSFSEGLPVVGIEAQVSGLPCLLSDNITKEVGITKQAIYLPISDTNIWLNKIVDLKNYQRKSNLKILSKSIYNLDNEVSKLEKYYIDIKLNKKDLIK